MLSENVTYNVMYNDVKGCVFMHLGYVLSLGGYSKCQVISTSG